MFEKVVVANRGAAAARIIRALNGMGVKSVAVYSEADESAPYLAMASEAHAIGGAAPAESYLNQDAILDVVKETNADGLHPGYGFLAENSDFAARVEAAECRFIGPAAQWLEAMGHKTRARDMMKEHGMPMGSSSSVLKDDDEALAAASDIGYPVLIKPAGGGGGIGMLPARDDEQLVKMLERARSMAERSFGTAEVYLERLLEQPRHIEFQMVADEHGNVRHLFERDCSVQRRHQKVIEEAPAPALAREVLVDLADSAASILTKMGYNNIGTVETLYDGNGGFNFLEMNTRLQVEHGVTEEVTGIDIVATQVRSSFGQPLSEILPDDVEISGHSIQARVYAEDPIKFFPSPGPLEVFRPPSGDGIRVDTGFAEGGTVTPYYDPMIAKVIVRGDERQDAIDKLSEALDEFTIEGIKTNIPFIQATLQNEAFVSGAVHTGLAEDVVATLKK
ncbi:MAG: biotin carboxylase [Alphaproteobacteria bacterium]|nr:biotin carboxylase [Alphaproteobacteria bacterium]|tara:strand:+ start:4143 stop:5492 length:1350 start_codon:yes stop_codon:yes gene_type:complete